MNKVVLRSRWADGSVGLVDLVDLGTCKYNSRLDENPKNRKIALPSGWTGGRTDEIRRFRRLQDKRTHRYTAHEQEQRLETCART